VNYYYTGLLAVCCLYAFVAGGWPEKIGATILGVGSILTVIAINASPARFQSVEVHVVVIDVISLIAFIILAVRSDRFWTIWVSAIMAVGALGHLARWYAGDAIGPWPYAFVIAVGSYPMMALIAIGTWNHQRRIRLTAPRATG
jgi:general stress protein CsbA